MRTNILKQNYILAFTIIKCTYQWQPCRSDPQFIENLYEFKYTGFKFNYMRLKEEIIYILRYDKI